MYKLSSLLFVLLIIATSSYAHPKKGWKALFNGKDLSGFRQLNGKAIYEVKNGELVGTTVPDQPNSFLATAKDYGDFV